MEKSTKLGRGIRGDRYSEDCQIRVRVSRSGGGCLTGTRFKSRAFIASGCGSACNSRYCAKIDKSHVIMSRTLVIFRDLSPRDRMHRHRKFVWPCHFLRISRTRNRRNSYLFPPSLSLSLCFSVSGSNKVQDTGTRASLRRSLRESSVHAIHTKPARNRSNNGHNRFIVTDKCVIAPRPCSAVVCRI